MECSLFHTTAIRDDNPVTALIDNGSMAYALIDKRLAGRLGLPLLETIPGQLQGVQETTSTERDGLVNQVTMFSLDIGAHKTQRVFAYVVSRQSEELILGRL